MVARCQAGLVGGFGWATEQAGLKTGLHWSGRTTWSGSGGTGRRVGADEGAGRVGGGG